MPRFKELVAVPSYFRQFASAGYKGEVITNDVTVIATAQTTSTATFTPTRVDLATAGSATGAVDMTGTDAQRAAAMQVAVRALGGIYATATVVAGSAGTYIFTVFGGYNITWATTATTPTITESGAAGGTTAVPGSVVYSRQVGGAAKFLSVKKIVLKNFNDNALAVSILDQAGKTVFVATVDTSTAAADTPYVKLLTADGVAGEDGAAAANTGGGTFTAPLTAQFTANAPVDKNPLALARCSLTVEDDADVENARILKRTSGARAALSGTFGLGAANAKIKRLRLLASSDTTVAPTLTDDDGLVVYTKTATDYTTAVLEQLSHEGVDQAGNAVADLLDVVAKSPITISGTGLGAGTFLIEAWVEV